MKLIIGDLHGHINFLDNIILKISGERNLSREEVINNLYITGDLFDRGNTSPESIFDYVLENNIKSIYGNHDHFLKNTYFYNRDEIPYFNSRENVENVWRIRGNGGDPVFRALESLRENKDEEGRNKFNKIIEYVKNLRPYIILEEEKIVITHSWYPLASLEIVGATKSGDIHELMGKIPMEDLVWSNIYRTMNSPLEEYTTKVTEGYRFVMGHFGMHRPMISCNLINICVDTAVYRSGMLSGLLVEDSGEIRLVMATEGGVEIGSEITKENVNQFNFW